MPLPIKEKRMSQSDSNGARAERPLDWAKSLGYSEEEMKSVPQGVACRGCGNPTAMAELKAGEIVLDLGCGSGLDAFLAARNVGPTGRVIGIDASADVVNTARKHAATGDYQNVEFRVGVMTALPAEDQSVDVVISNCVINYSADISATFREIFRCLKPAGRILIADLVTQGEFSQDALEDPLWGEWLAGAVGKQVYLSAIDEAGFRNASVVAESLFPMAEKDDRLRGKILSIQVKASK
jgi:SAM-dependent methyltransferase